MSMWNQPQHTYEEVRELVVDILLKRSPDQWLTLIQHVSEEFAHRSGLPRDPLGPPPLHPYDAELVRDVFWDLFRQGFITLGKDTSNPMWPWSSATLDSRRCKPKVPIAFTIQLRFSHW